MYVRIGKFVGTSNSSQRQPVALAIQTISTVNLDYGITFYLRATYFMAIIAF